VDNPVRKAVLSFRLMRGKGTRTLCLYFEDRGQDAFAPYLVVLSQENKHSDLRIERGFWLLEMRKAGPRRRFVKTYAQTPHCQGVFSSFFAIPDQRA
jgi:hypothetical protein